MMHNSQRGRHLRPFVYETHKSKTLHFSICDVQSTMHLADPERLVVPYTRLMMGFLLFAPEPKRIVMVGLGGGSLAKFCHRHLPHACVEVVEINPHVIALRREFAIPEDGVRFKVRMEDAADYMRTSQTRCDVILADGFDANGVPANLCSRSFYDNCFDLLTPGGVLVANLHGHHEHCPVYLERLRKSFAGRVLIVPEPDSTNIIAFAFRDMPRHLDAGELTGLERLSSEVEEQLAQSFVQIERAIEKMSQVRSLHLVE